MTFPLTGLESVSASSVLGCRKYSGVIVSERHCRMFMYVWWWRTLGEFRQKHFCLGTGIVLSLSLKSTHWQREGERSDNEKNTRQWEGESPTYISFTYSGLVNLHSASLRGSALWKSSLCLRCRHVVLGGRQESWSTPHSDLLYAVCTSAYHDPETTTDCLIKHIVKLSIMNIMLTR